MSRGTLEQTGKVLLFIYMAVTFYGGPFQTSSIKFYFTLLSVLNPNPRRAWFGLFPVRSPLLRKSIILSLPLGT